MIDKRKERRRFNYKQLRTVGFTSKQASKYQDRSKKVIQALLDEKVAHNRRVKEIVNG